MTSRSDERKLPGKRRVAGMTIIKLMVLLGIVGIIATVVVDLVIEKRCRDEPTAMLCKKTQPPAK
jgi:Tfp pilus assembly protein PilE